MSDHVKVYNKDDTLLYIRDEEDMTISDGYHTFKELYHHRAILFAVICNTYKDISWKSKLHGVGDKPMFDEMFIVGINTPDGQYSYHYNMEYWDMFDVRVLEHAPEYDGHKPEDVGRLLSLLNK